MEPSTILFAHVAARPEENIDLAAAALLVAEQEYPGLDVSHYLTKLSDMARAARSISGSDHGLAALNSYLFGELGFRGNEDDYYDPRNSFMNQVIDRRVGIPITLSILYLEVGRRMGLDLDGVSFPGHFLVRYRGPEGELFLDPYHLGKRLSHEELEDLLEHAFGEKTTLSKSHLHAASKRQILTRMLNNLRGIYQRRGDDQRHGSVLERLAILNPGDERIEASMATLRKRAGMMN